MKKLVFILAMILPVLAFTACSDDDDKDFIKGFDYDAKMLYGTWTIEKVGPIDWPFEATTATFNSDGTYSGKGYYGTGSGNYTASGNEIKCYVSGELYMRYVVESLSGDTATMTVYGGSGTSDGFTITCKKIK